MKRRSTNGEGAAVPLFPFLAVLLCTMGALIILLVVMARQARLDAAEEARAKRPAARGFDESEVQKEREDLALLAKQYEDSRDKTAEELADRRRSLSYIESHIRELRDNATKVRAAIDELEKTGDATAADRKDAEDELTRLREQIADAAKKLDEARKAATGRRPSYAVVPYEGGSGTRRRPIYIECRADSVVLQPEGIVLTAADFVEPIGPGNALAAAMRAAQEHLAQIAPGSGGGEPYPLLLVRPDGIAAYYKARAGLEFFGPDFGYEMIGADWDLEFPPADPRLAQMQMSAVADARQRRERLAAAAPSRYGNSRETYRVAPTQGGVYREGGDEDFGSSARTVAMQMERYRGDEGSGGSSYGTGEGTGQRGRYGEILGGGDSSAGDALGAGGRGTGDHILGHGGNDPLNNGLGAGSGRPGDGGFGGSELGSSNGRPGGEGFGRGSELGGSHLPGGTGGRYAEGQSQGNGSSQQGGAVGANQNHPSGQGGRYGEPGRAGEYGGSPSGTPSLGASGAGGSSGGTPGANGGQGGGSTGGTSSGTPTVAANMSGGSPSGMGGSMADTRGVDWAIPDKARDAVPITRPVRVVCRGDRLAILPDQRGDAGRVVMLGERTDRAMDEFVSHLWDHMKRWGMAGRGMYWRPILVLDVAPDGVQRAAELERILQGSGLEIRRAEANVARPFQADRASATQGIRR